MSELRIYAQQEPFNDVIGIAIRDRSQWATLTWETKPEGGYISPAVRIDMHAAQMLMDDLWHCGLRPTAGKQSEGVTAAQGAHLEDMRAIAFAKLNIPRASKGEG